MSITPEAPAKTLTQLVATEIKVAMARRDVRQSQLARAIGKTEMWLSVRLRGVQPIDMNDLALIARGLGAGIHELLPPPEVAAGAEVPQSTIRYPLMAERSPIPGPVHGNRPPGRPSGATRPGVSRTAYVERPARRKRDR